YRDLYREGGAQRTAFDVARLFGFLEAFRPEGRSWRQAVAEHRPFSIGLEVSCVDALKAVGLSTPASLMRMFRTQRYRDSVRSFAASAGIAPGQVAHL